MRGNTSFGNKNRPMGNRNFNNQNRSGGFHRHNSLNRHFKPTQKPFIPHVLFDFIHAEHAFPRVKPVSAQEEKAFNDALIKRNQDLTPSSNEQTQLLNSITKIQAILDNLIISPGDFDACQFDEIRQVGSFKKGTMLMSSKLVADICVVLKTLPTREAVNVLANKVFEEFKKTVTNPLELKNLQLSLNESGFEICLTAFASITAVDVAIQVLVTTQYQNIRKLDPSLHLDAKLCQLSLASVKHARWFEENASHTTIKVLIRLLKDIRLRFDGLTPLNPWIIDLMAHYAVMNNPKREPLSLVVAFKRVFQLVSAGFFLPGSAGIIDPCEHSPTRVHTTMTLEQQDSVCYTFQTLLRVLAHGGYRQIIGLEGNSSIATTHSVWAGVVIIPSSKAYEPSLEQQSEDKDEEMNQSNEDATATNDDTNGIQSTTNNSSTA